MYAWLYKNIYVTLDESLTAECEMFKGWLRGMGKQGSLGQQMYLSGKNEFFITAVK